ncbi:proline-rich protein 12-like [Pollicipes pollicipes]|uniref:proline-rich protein 12-like n=1 Tax=Pollicipes pollicipes TaxID=41117 RepID=UPI0018850634|nr:proline-rich protein 12-like [Pollicipes pollicipes]
MEDANLDRPPIWRIDGKFLIQKYEPIKGKGQRLYKNMATYMSWSSNADKFRPVTVRYHQMGRNEIIVELMDNPHSATFNMSKMLSIEETSKHLESFEIYIQTLISQALDPNFLLEITEEGDEYFMKNVNIVKGISEARKKKILELKSWDEKTQSDLDTLPVLELVLLRNVPPSECAICHQMANARLVHMYGRPYDPTSLQPLVEAPAAAATRCQYNMCSFCAGLADLYHKVVHQTFHLYLRCCEKVAARRREAPDEDSTHILNDILAEESWLSKTFSDVQLVWGDVDQIYTAAKEEEEEEKNEGGASSSGR